jgi:hypothetical protein
MRGIKISLVLLLIVTLVSCETKESAKVKTENAPPSLSFNPDTLKIPDQGGRKLKGQVLYMPIYSNIPSNQKQPLNINAFLAIHNTDLTHEIKITKVDFFNTDGQLCKSFLADEQIIKPLATVIFTIPREDQSGTGANFIIEWMAAQSVNAPLVESIMTDLSGNLGFSFLSQGRIIREIE